MLGFQTGYEMDGFLKRWQIDRDAYGVEEYEQDLQTLKRMRGTESTTAR